MKATVGPGRRRLPGQSEGHGSHSRTRPRRGLGPWVCGPLKPALSALLAAQAQHLVFPQHDCAQVLPPEVSQLLGVQLHGPGASTCFLQLLVPRAWRPPERPTVVPALGCWERRTPKATHTTWPLPPEVLSAQLCLYFLVFSENSFRIWISTISRVKI